MKQFLNFQTKKKQSLQTSATTAETSFFHDVQFFFLILFFEKNKILKYHTLLLLFEILFLEKENRKKTKHVFIVSFNFVFV